jgi:hypothetical protein
MIMPLTESCVRIPGWALLELAEAGYIARLITHAAADPQRDLVPVPASWAAPLVDWIRAFEDMLAAPESSATPLDAIAAFLATIPAVYDKMDHDALAGVLESGLAAGIVEGASLSLAKISTAPLRTFAPTLAAGPLAAAVAKMEAKTPLAIALRSDQWARTPLWIRERSQFSSRVESARLLQTIQNRIEDRLSWTRQQIAKSDTAAGGEAFVDRSSFIAEVRAVALEEGIDTTTPNNYGTVRDIKSARRLGLIYDMQTNQATEFARFKMDHDPDVLDAYPAQRLVRVEERENPRPAYFWPSRWEAAYQKVAGAGALADDMVALKTSPIWSALSIFGTPWPPFDWGSGMGLEDVDRDEAEELGLVPKDAPVPQLGGGAEDFNARLEAGVSEISPRLQDAIRDSFGNKVQIVDGVAKWIGA